MAEEAAVGPGTRVELGAWVAREENGRHVVGWPERGVWFEAEGATARALALLAEGRSVEETRKRLRRETREDHDVEALVRELLDGGLATARDGRRAGARATTELPRALAPLRSRVAPILALAVALAAVVALARDRALLAPPGEALAVAPSPLASLVLATLASIAVVMLHELGHGLVARAYGLAPRLRVSARQFFPVVETDVTGAWALAKGPRLRVFAAGVVVNAALLLAVAVAHAALARGGAPPAWALPGARLLVLLNLFQIGYQLLLFLRTDLYFLATAATGEWNLHADAWAALGDAGARALRRALGRPQRARPREAARHRRGVVGAYAALALAGTLASLALVAYVAASLATDLAPRVAARVADGARGDAWALAEGLAAGAYVAAFVAFALRHWLWAPAAGLARWARAALAEPAQG